MALEDAVLAEAVKLDDSTWRSGAPSSLKRWSVGTAEAPHYAHAIADRDGDDDVLAVFRRFDSDGSGSISAREMSSVLQALDPDRWTDVAVKELFKVADVNDDGDLDIEEFVTFVFYNDDGKEVVKSVFDSVPDETCARLFEANERRTKIVISITPSDLDLIMAWDSPPRIVSLVMSSICWLIHEKGSSDSHEAWNIARDLCFERPREFLQGLIDPPWNITSTSLALAEEFVKDRDFSIESVESSPSLGSAKASISALLTWVLAIIEIHHALLEFGPLPARVEGEDSSSTMEMSRTISMEITQSMSSSQSVRSDVEQIAKPWAEVVSRINRHDLVELKNFKRPPPLVHLVCSAVCWLLTQQGHSDTHYSWRLSRRLMNNTTKFLSMLMNPPLVGPEVIAQVENIIKYSGVDFSAENANQVSRSLAALVDWVLCVLRLHQKSLEFTIGRT